MNLSYFIASRYLWAKRKTGFISVISMISIAGVALGSAALIITLSIIAGFEKELQQKFISFDAHIRLKTFDGTGPISDPADVEAKIRQIPAVKSISPYVEKEAMIRSRSNTDGVLVKGIDSKKASAVLSVQGDLVQGSFGFDVIDTNASGRASKSGILVGQKLADKLNVKLGDRLTLFSLKNTLAFIEQPKVRQFRISGIYRSGLAEYDNVYVYIDIDEAQKLFIFENSITGYEIRLDNIQNANDVATQLNNSLGYPFYAKTWFDIHKNLYGWLESNNFIMLIIFGLIIVVAGFNIIGTLFMIVIEKTRDIGILKSMGASLVVIRNIYLLEGCLIGSIGASSGAALALILMGIQLRFKPISLDSDVYFMDSVPIDLNAEYFLGISIFSIALCMIAAIYPAYRAAKLDAVQAIRYE